MTKSHLYCYNWGFLRYSDRYSSRRFYSPGKCLDHHTISKWYVTMTIFYFDGAVQVLPLLISGWIKSSQFGSEGDVYMTNLCLLRSPGNRIFCRVANSGQKHVYKPLLFCFLIKKLWIKHVHFLVLLKNTGKHDILFSPLLFPVPGKVGTVQ